jgi:hypothetical protein
LLPAVFTRCIEFISKVLSTLSTRYTRQDYKHDGLAHTLAVRVFAHGAVGTCFASCLTSCEILSVEQHLVSHLKDRTKTAKDHSAFTASRRMYSMVNCSLHVTQACGALQTRPPDTYLVYPCRCLLGSRYTLSFLPNTFGSNSQCRETHCES